MCVYTVFMLVNLQVGRSTCKQYCRECTSSHQNASELVWSRLQVTFLHSASHWEELNLVSKMREKLKIPADP